MFRGLTVKSYVTQRVYVVKIGSYIQPNQAVREEEHNGERDHHLVPEECQNILTIHPDWVVVGGRQIMDPLKTKRIQSQRNI